MIDLAEKPRVAPRARPEDRLSDTSILPKTDLEARALTKRYDDTPVFSDVSFRLTRGDSVALVGANGTGKSTLLRCLMGLIAPTAGEVRVLDRDTSALRGAPLRSLRAQVGMVSQKHNLVPRLSVLSNVIHGTLGLQSGPRRWSHMLAPEDVRDAAMEALGNVGLAHLAARRADRLSGGQSQRVAIARALIADPKIVIADEPCASLDPSAGEEVMELLFNLARTKGVTVMFTSHQIDHALSYGERILGLAGGKLHLDAPAASLRAADLRGLYV